jgi:uncharacterized protein DUF397
MAELAWRTSSYSANGGDCVEVAWRTSSYSANGGSCVEVAWPKPAGTAVRDSKNVTGPTLEFDTTTWRAFLRRI